MKLGKTLINANQNGIKAGEHYYYEKFDKQMEDSAYCIECSAFFMAQKLAFVIPLARKVKE